MVSNFSKRIKIVGFLVSFVAFLVIARLFQVQVINSSYYQGKGENSYSSKISAIDRGSIYFKEKEGNLVGGAVMKTGYILAIKPDLVIDPEILYSKLDPFIEMEKEEFIQKAGKKGDPYEEIENRLTLEEVTKIKALEEKSLVTTTESWRFYPGSTLASQVLGIVAFKGNDLGGRYGIERSYEDVLRGKKEKIAVNIFAELFSGLSGDRDDDRGDLVTTIEPTVESHLENSLSNIKNKWGARTVGGIIMDPKTGEIIAMASTPSFDANNFKDIESVSVLSNPSVERVYEFGSVVKPLIMAAALDRGVVTPETTYFDSGFVQVEDKVINNFDKKGRGLVSMQDVLNQSLNTGMVFVYNRLGKDNMRDYLTKYGMRDKTGIDLPGEVKPLTSNLESPRNLEYANASFGQGIAMTPINLISALSVLANGGYRVTPHVGYEIQYEDGRKERLFEEEEKKEKVLSDQALLDIRDMLITVVDEGYSQYHLSLSDYAVAAKTGTGQIARSDGKGYVEGENMHTLFGFFPAYDPQFIMLFYAEAPNARYAIESLSSEFFDIIKFMVSYYDIPPDR